MTRHPHCDFLRERADRCPRPRKLTTPKRPERPPTRRGKPDKPSRDVVEGRNPVLEALRGDRPINKVLIARGVGRYRPIAEILRLARDASVVVEWVDGRAVDRLSTTGRNQGVVALTAPKAYADLEELLEISVAREEPLLLAMLDGIEDPQNLGAIVRTADAAGVHGVVIPDRRAAPLTAAVARASAGALGASPRGAGRQPVQRHGPAGPATTSGPWAWTLPARRDYTQVDYRQPTAIVIGAEGKGLSRLVKERCDILASIPMRGKVASLNASVAAALVMFEAARQRSAAREALTKISL